MELSAEALFKERFEKLVNKNFFTEILQEFKLVQWIFNTGSFKNLSLF